MNRINKLFENRKKKILSVYFTAGYPELNDTPDIIRELDKAGVDMIEIGMPFSDPVADGPVIQRSSEIALRNGMNIKLLFKQLTRVREITDMPLILMGYINPVLRYGMENFLKRCHETGIDGTIIPDLPPDVYLESYEPLFVKNDIINIFLVTPQSTVERIKYLDQVSRGFIYVVSTSKTTGGVNNFNQSNMDYFRKLDNLKLKSPRMVGFGISDRTTYNQSCEYSDGAIIGSTFIRALEEKGSLSENIRRFVKTFR
jgi:tryptophan synthase alpha chain